MLLFVVIEAVAFHYYANSSSYTQARLLAQSHRIAGGVHGFFAEATHYFGLERKNRLLVARIAELEAELAWRRRNISLPNRLNDSLCEAELSPQYEMMMATVIANSINKQHNFIILDRGRRAGVEPDMAVLSPLGAMVGYVVEVSERYAVAISVLNTAFRASGKIAGEDYFGLIQWNGTDASHVTMSELSKYAQPERGDTIVSTGFSQYFPAGIPIGTVESALLNEAQTAYTVEVKLMAEMSGLGTVILVHNRDLPEVKTLMSSERIKELEGRP